MRGLPREHGTLRGFRQHQKRGEPICRPCLDAENAREKEKRRTDPRYREMRREYIAARGRALTRIAARYPEEMAVYLAAELAQGSPTPDQPTKRTRP